LQIVTELKDQIKACKFAKRNMSSLNAHENKTIDNTLVEKRDIKLLSPLQQEWVEANCCVLMRKPIEKILIRYEKIPTNFLTTFGSGSMGANVASQSATLVANHLNSSLCMLETLSRYFHHQRWVWSTQQGTNVQLPLVSLARILSVLTK
jgi:KICSTOR complex protein SZT2